MRKKIILLFTVIAFAEKSISQGCSDAGFCTLPYHLSTASKADKNINNTLITDITFGLGEGNTTLLTPSVLYRRKLNHQFSWDNKITASFISGKMGSIFNAGDWYSTISYTIGGSKKTDISLAGGVKIPFTSANDKINGQPLPMAYQTSLGTYDFLLGVAWLIKKKIDINAALQAPLINENKNTFFREFSAEKDFESTNNFKRKPDVLLRFGYNLNSKNNKWLFKPNALAILHIGEDSYENVLGKRETIKGSSGLTLNLNLQAQYKIAQFRYVTFSVASPVIIRDSRPDGLTRSLTASVNYQFGF